MYEGVGDWSLSTMHPSLQFGFGAVLGLCLLFVFELVRRRKIADQYGLCWCLALGFMIFFDIGWGWPSFGRSLLADGFILGDLLVLIALGVLGSIRSTASLVRRRRLIQDRALLELNRQTALESEWKPCSSASLS